MNWMGGARNRVTFQDENKQQKDFFQRQRLSAYGSILKRSPKKSVLSNDLRALQTVSKIHSSTIGDNSKPRHVMKIDLDRFKSCTRQIKDVDLGPMSPTEAPSKLLIMDLEGNSRKEKNVSKLFPVQQKYSKHSESQDTVAKIGAPNLTRKEVEENCLNLHTDKSNSRNLHTPHNKRRYSDIEKTETSSRTAESSKRRNEMIKHFTSTPYDSHSSKFERYNSTHRFGVPSLDNLSPIQKIDKENDNDDDGFKFKPRLMVQKGNKKQCESQNQTITTDRSPSIFCRSSLISKKDKNTLQCKEAIGTPRSTPSIQNVYAKHTPYSQNLSNRDEFKTPFQFAKKKADGHASWSFRKNEHSTYLLESPGVDHRNSSADESYHSDNGRSHSFHKHSMKGVRTPTIDNSIVGDGSSALSRHKNYDNLRNNQRKSPGVFEGKQSDFASVTDHKPSTKVVDRVSTVMNLYSSHKTPVMNLYSSQKTPHLEKKTDRDSYCTEQFSKINWQCQPFSEARNLGSQSPKAADEFPSSMQIPISMASRTTDGKKSVTKTMSSCESLEDVNGRGCVTTPPKSYTKMSNNMTDLLKEMHYLEAQDSDIDLIKEDKRPKSDKQDTMNKDTENDEADRFLEYEDMMEKACIEHSMKEDRKRMAQLSGDGTMVADTPTDSEDLISDNSLYQDSTLLSFVDIGHSGGKHDHDRIGEPDETFIATKLCLEEELSKSALDKFQDNAYKSTRLNNQTKDNACIVPDSVPINKEGGEYFKISQENAHDNQSRYCYQEENHSNKSTEVQRSPVLMTVKRPSESDNNSKDKSGRKDDHSTVLVGIDKSSVGSLERKMHQVLTHEAELKCNNNKGEASENTGHSVKIEVTCKFDSSNPAENDIKDKSERVFSNCKRAVECDQTGRTNRIIRADDSLSNKSFSGLQDPTISDSRLQEAVSQYKVKSDDVRLAPAQCQVAERFTSPIQLIDSKVSHEEQMPLHRSSKHAEQISSNVCSKMSSDEQKSTIESSRLPVSHSVAASTTSSSVFSTPSVHYPQTISPALSLYTDTLSSHITCSRMNSSITQPGSANTSTVPIVCSVAVADTSTPPIPCSFMEASTSPIPCTFIEASTSPIPCSFIEASTSPILFSFIEASTSPIPCSFIEASTSPIPCSFIEASTSPIPCSFIEASTSPISCTFIEASTSPIPCSFIEASTSPIPCTFIEASTSPIPCSFIEQSTSPKIPCSFIEASTSPIHLIQDTDMCSFSNKSFSPTFHSNSVTLTSSIPLASVSSVQCSDLMSDDCNMIKKETSCASCTHMSVALSPMVTMTETERLTLGRQCDVSKASVNNDKNTGISIPSLSNLATGSVVSFAKCIQNVWNNPFTSKKFKKYRPEQ